MITGVVRDAGGEPVGGAYVRLLDATGEFTAEVVTSPAGQFRFFAAPGHVDAAGAVPARQRRRDGHRRPRRQRGRALGQRLILGKVSLNRDNFPEVVAHHGHSFGEVATCCPGLSPGLYAGLVTMPARSAGAALPEWAGDDQEPVAGAAGARGRPPATAAGAVVDGACPGGAGWWLLAAGAAWAVWRGAPTAREQTTMVDAAPVMTRVQRRAGRRGVGGRPGRGGTVPGGAVGVRRERRAARACASRPRCSPSWRRGPSRPCCSASPTGCRRRTRRGCAPARHPA